jgi:hypothetical protein
MTERVPTNDADRRLAEFTRLIPAELQEDALDLAAHAALPVVLNPDLLHLLRINFFLDTPRPLPYAVEARLLLSPLCRDLGDGLYEMLSTVRDRLLERLDARFGPQNGHAGRDRVREVATLLWQYTERSAPWAARPALERAQQLTALRFIDPARARSWLKDTASSLGARRLPEQWFVAMQQELQEPPPPLSSPGPLVEPEILSRALLSLDFEPQSAVLHETLAERWFAVFLIQGSRSYAQRWLLYRLLREIPATALEVVQLGLGAATRTQRRWEFNARLAQRVGAAPGSDWAIVAGHLSEKLRSHAVALVFNGVENAEPSLLRDLLMEFWNVALARAVREAPGALGSRPLLMFLVDYGGNVAASGGPLDPASAPDGLFEHLIVLPPIQSFSSESLRHWLESAANDLPRELTSDPDRTVTDILRDTKGVPEPTLRRLCERCGLFWDEIELLAQPPRPSNAEPEATVLTEIRKLAREYEQVRASPALDSERAKVADDIVVRMRSLPHHSDTSLPILTRSEVPGERLVAIVLLQERPNSEYLLWLARRIGIEGPFVAINTVLALQRAAEQLDTSLLGQVRDTVTLIRSRLGTDPWSDIVESLDRVERTVADRQQQAKPVDEEFGRVAAEIERLANEYTSLRRIMTFSSQRTAAMDHIADEMTRLPAAAARLLPQLTTNQSAGMRLVAVCLLYANPDPRYLSWLAERLESERHFVGFHAARALHKAAALLPGEHLAQVQAVLVTARRGAETSGDPHQQSVLNAAEGVLQLRLRSLQNASRLAPGLIKWLVDVVAEWIVSVGPGFMDALLAVLPQEIVRRLPFDSVPARMARNIIQAVQADPALLKRLIEAVRYFAGDTDQLRNLEEVVARLSEQQPRAETLTPMTPTAEERPASTGSWKLWPNGATLRVRFLDGAPGVWQKVQQYSLEWTKYANLRLAFLELGSTEDAEIRITFKEPGSWSALGTDALDRNMYPLDRPTMCLGSVTLEMQEEQTARVIRHEFGHALGLLHEHQNPNAEFPWNRDAVYRDLAGPPNNWDRVTVDHNIFQTYDRSALPWYRPFDPDSIMLNPMPKHWFLGEFAIRITAELSESDRAFIAWLYPRKSSP